ncbi:putative cytochrome P450 [Porphyridium purpureum]|uniref:Putative cytochrome P450 n=1 Tax=Porphyridium purpureum TaxID=35688 RepID=A0A5J4YSC7_PORPP|nr:putative cytochrome P450 [Porphyridium purpureum]|eukprot:POR2153..scf236_6
MVFAGFVEGFSDGLARCCRHQQQLLPGAGHGCQDVNTLPQLSLRRRSRCRSQSRLWMASPHSGLNLPPGDKGLPLLGDFLSFTRGGAAGFEGKFEKYKSDVVTSRILTIDTVLVKGFDQIRPILESPMEPAWPGTVDELLKGSMPTIKGEPHKARREIISRIAFSRERLLSYAPFLQANVQQLIANIEARTASSAQTYARFRDEIEVMAFNAAAVLFLGAEDVYCGAGSGQKGDGLDIDERLAQFQRFEGGLFTIPLKLPFLQTPWSEALDAKAALLAFTRRAVEKRIEAKQQSGPLPTITIMDHLVDMHLEGDGVLTKDIVISELLTLVWAGHSTILSFMQSMVYELFMGGTHDVVRRIRASAEYRAALESDEAWSHYLKLIIKPDLVNDTLLEIERLRPPVQSVFRKPPPGGMQVGAYHIPEGWTVLLSIFSTHRDPVYFPEPLAFRPERFAESPELRKILLGFSGGARVCIGKYYAELFCRIFLLTFLRHGDVVMDPAQSREFSVLPGYSPKDGVLGRFQKLALSE